MKFFLPLTLLSTLLWFFVLRAAELDEKVLNNTISLLEERIKELESIFGDKHKKSISKISSRFKNVGDATASKDKVIKINQTWEEIDSFLKGDTVLGHVRTLTWSLFPPEDADKIKNATRTTFNASPETLVFIPFFGNLLPSRRPCFYELYENYENLLTALKEMNETLAKIEVAIKAIGGQAEYTVSSNALNMEILFDRLKSLHDSIDKLDSAKLQLLINQDVFVDGPVENRFHFIGQVKRGAGKFAENLPVEEQRQVVKGAIRDFFRFIVHLYSPYPNTHNPKLFDALITDYDEKDPIYNLYIKKALRYHSGFNRSSLSESDYEKEKLDKKFAELVFVEDLKSTPEIQYALSKALIMRHELIAALNNFNDRKRKNSELADQALVHFKATKSDMRSFDSFYKFMDENTPYEKYGYFGSKKSKVSFDHLYVMQRQCKRRIVAGANVYVPEDLKKLDALPAPDRFPIKKFLPRTLSILPHDLLNIDFKSAQEFFELAKELKFPVYYTQYGVLLHFREHVEWVLNSFPYQPEEFIINVERLKELKVILEADSNLKANFEMLVKNVYDHPVLEEYLMHIFNKSNLKSSNYSLNALNAISQFTDLALTYESVFGVDCFSLPSEYSPELINMLKHSIEYYRLLNQVERDQTSTDYWKNFYKSLATMLWKNLDIIKSNSNFYSRLQAKENDFITKAQKEAIEKLTDKSLPEQIFAVAIPLKKAFKVSLGLFRHLYRLTASDSIDQSKLMIGEEICELLKVLLNWPAQNNLELHKKLILALFNVMQKNNYDMNQFAAILLKAAEKCKMDTKSTDSISVGQILQNIANEKDIQSLFRNLLKHSMILIWNSEVLKNHPIGEKNVGKFTFDTTETTEEDAKTTYTLETPKIERLTSPFSTPASPASPDTQLGGTESFPSPDKTALSSGDVPENPPQIIQQSPPASTTPKSENSSWLWFVVITSIIIVVIIAAGFVYVYIIKPRNADNSVNEEDVEAQED